MTPHQFIGIDISRPSLLVSDQQIIVPYLQAKLGAARVTRLSQLAIAQRHKLVALAEVTTAQRQRHARPAGH